MRVATGKVVDGTVKLDGLQLVDGTEVFVLVREQEEDVRLSAEERAELEAGIAEADRGDMLTGEEFFSRLRRYG
ncbi:MAG: hypothetical protein WCZ28_13530 [Burkholderiaceae bacterium]